VAQAHAPQIKSPALWPGFRQFGGISFCLPLRFLALGFPEDSLPLAQMLAPLLDGGQLPLSDVGHDRIYAST
jgi:hypothetical protein